VFEFTTEHQPGSWPIAPANHETNVALNTGFTWSSTDNGSYVLQISQQEDFSALLENQSLQDDTTFTSTKLRPFSRYYWRVLSDVANGNETLTLLSETFTFETITPTAATEYVNVQSAYGFPNPFKLGVDIVITSTTNGPARLRVIDQMGKEVKNFSLELTQGENIIHWNGNDNHEKPIPGGLYYALLNGGGARILIRLAKIQ
jgi:hypothetical protein